MKIGANSRCPCGSEAKYKNCCKKYHNGLIAKDALTLMKSRYSAYAVGDAKYIIKTTHPNNSQYLSDTQKWIKEIKAFCFLNKFQKLEIVEYINIDPNEAYVTFIATINNQKMIEKSRFVKEKKRWLYESGEFLEESVIS